MRISTLFDKTKRAVNIYITRGDSNKQNRSEKSSEKHSVRRGDSMASRDLKGLTIEIGGDTSNLTTALKSVDKELSSLQANLRTVNSALKLDPGNVDALTQKQALLTEAVTETAKRLETLKEAQRQADQQIADGVDVDQQAYRSLQSEIVRAEASLNDYQRQLDDTGAELADLADGTHDASNQMEDMADATEDAGNSAEDASDGWTIVKDVIADLASKAIQAAIDAFKDLVFEAESALDLLQAKTGASAETMQKYGAVARDVFKNGWGESLSDVTDAIGTITNMLGDLDEASLRNITENAMTLEDVFGWDVKESVRAAKSMMDQFGISSDEAFNLMVQGAQNGLDQNDDLIDTINEYSVQFANAGYSADEMFNMLANGAEEGTWSVDKLGDAVKEYNIRMSDGTVVEYIQKNAEALGLTAEQAEVLGEKIGESGDSGKEAMSAILQGILSIEDPTERYKAGVGAFGTMWEDLGENAVRALFETKGGIESTNDAMGQVKTDAYDNLATSISTLGRTLKTELLQPIVDAISPAVKDLVNWAIEHMEIVKPIILGLAAAFGVLAGALAISGVISAVQKAMALLNATLLANPITLVVAAIAGIVAAFVAAYNSSETFRNIVNSALQAVWAVVQPIAEAIKNALVQAWEAIKAVWSYCAPFFEAIWNSIKVGVEFIKNTLVSAFQTAWDVIKSVWAVVSSYFQNIWNTIAGIFSVVKAVLSGDFRGAWEAIKGIVSGWTGFFRTVWNSIKNIFGSVTGFFRTTFSNAWTAVKNVFTNWGSFFGGLWDTIKNKFSSIGTSIADAIGGAVKSGINGVISAIERTINKGVGLINGAIDLINLIPGVSVGKVKELKLPRLAKGGVVYEPTLAEIGEYAGAKRNPEIVAPQDILRKTFDESLAKFKSDIDVHGEDNREIHSLREEIVALREIVSEYLPEISSRTKKSIYLDKRRLVGELAPDIDEALGDIASRKAVGAI